MNPQFDLQEKSLNCEGSKQKYPMPTGSTEEGSSSTSSPDYYAQVWTSALEPSNDFCLTVSGKRFYYTAEHIPPSSIDINDIAHSLALQCRFVGRVKHPYSIAQHSLNCVAAAIEFHNVQNPHDLLALLMHDAAEAYIGDIIRPYKNLIKTTCGYAASAGEWIYRRSTYTENVSETQGFASGVYKYAVAVRDCEQRIQSAIERKYRIHLYDYHEIDNRMCRTESGYLCAEPCLNHLEPYALDEKAFSYMDPFKVRDKFVETFNDLVQLRADWN